MEDRLPRKLAAILYADVAGYSRLTALDEDQTHRTLTKSLDLIAELVRAHRGRVGHYAGDAVLADFASATDALECALRVQQMRSERNAALPEEHQLQFRIGINLGEVIDDRGEVYGDGVNIAARLEALAVPGGICVSDAVRSAVGNRLSLRFANLGDCKIKNIPTPIHAWQVHGSARRLEKAESVVFRAEVRAFSVLMGVDNRETRNALDRARLMLTSEIEKRGGDVLDTPGEAVLSEFDEIKECVVCAQQVRDAIEQTNAGIEAQERVHYRYSIDVGRLDRSEAGVLGPTITRTATLCASAPPNEIHVTDVVRGCLEDDGQFTFSAIANNTYVLSRSKETNEESTTVPPQLESLDLPLPEKPSIVLSPFTFIGEDPAGDAFADGFRIDIQNALVKMSGLFLIAAGAANAFRGKDPIEAARLLGVRHVLEGSVRRSGERVRVNVQLTDTADSVVSWAEQYDRGVDDEFTLQDEITERVITALDVKLASGEQARVWRKCLSSPRARDLFYRGIHQFFQMNADSIAKAKGHFERIVELVPDSPLGPTWIAMCLWFEATRGWAAEPEQARFDAGVWAEKAVASEDADGQAHTVLGNVRLLQRRYEEAVEVARRAVAIRPGCTNSNGFLANVLLHCGEPQGALTHIKRAIRLSPVYPPWFLEILAASYREAGEIGLAVIAAQEVLRLTPHSIQGRVILVSSLARAGWAADAKRVGAEILSEDQGFSLKRFSEQQVFRDEAVVERIVEDLREAGLPE
jgi:class 3 adenylate cyclase/TolB-like protein